MKTRAFMLPVSLSLILAIVPVRGGAAPGQPEHPVLNWDIDPRGVKSYERAVQPVMAMSEAEMLRLIPTKACITFCGCPNCTGGQQENGQFQWTIERPLELRCRFCGHVYPSSTYPANATASGTNALGETVTYRFFLDKKTGRDYWLEAHADRLRRDWFVGQCLTLARAYHLTRKSDYARRAALILDRFGEAYPRMAVLSQWPFRRRAVVAPRPPYPSAGGKWGRWMPDEVPSRLPEAYDLICASPALDQLSGERGVDVRRRIENDFFRAAIEYAFTFGKEPTGAHLNNMSPYYVRNIIQIGRILNEPAYVHWGYRWVGEILRGGFFYDGMWHEAPSYHYQTIGGIRLVIEALRGYSDPPNHLAADGLRLTDVDMEKQLPLVAKAVQAPSLVAYPHGRIAPIHDTWASGRSGAPREETVSTLLPGFGHASLGCGTSEDQFQAQLHFSGAYGHSHADSLNLALFAKGAEMFSDLGYSHGKLRRWTTSTVGHNTVVIDRKEQGQTDSDGDLVMFVPDAAGLSVVEVIARQAYPKLAQDYRRQLILVPVSKTDAYVVDIFRVKGGSVHDWLLHGSADEDMTAECSLELASREGTMLEPGETWKEPIGESSPLLPYGLIRDVRQATSRNPFEVTFRYAAPGGPLAGVGVRTHLAAGPATEVFLGRSPRLRQAEGDDRKAYDYWMPQLVVRRRGPAPLQSVFAAVHEPFRDKPFLGQIGALAAEPAQAGVVALRVAHGAVTDTIISTIDAPPYPERHLAGGISLRGRLAVLRQRAGRIEQAWLIDGDRLALGNYVLKSQAARSEGLIDSATRKADGAAEDAFATSADLPEGEELAGRWLTVTHGNGHKHAYQIGRVDRAGGKSMIVLTDDHGLRITGDQTEECYFPHRKIAGRNRFVLIGWVAEHM